jgi:hypothetical protein
VLRRAAHRSILRCVTLAATLTAGACDPPGADEPPPPEQVCTEPHRTGTLPDRLAGASGVAISRTHAGVLWMHNNAERSGRLFAVDSTGSIRAALAVPDTRNIDWEDIAIARCDTGDCLYIADIGDNLHQRADIGFFRIPEPRPTDEFTAAPEWFPISYPHGPQDAEALFILPGEQVFIITKGRNRSITVYRYPPPLRPGIRVELETVQELSDGVVQMPELITGASATYDGAVIAVRSYAFLWLYNFDDTLQPLLEPAKIDLRPLGEPQGEAVAIGDDGRIVLAGERGVNGSAAPVVVLTCRLATLRGEG